MRMNRVRRRLRCLFRSHQPQVRYTEEAGHLLVWRECWRCRRRLSPGATGRTLQEAQAKLEWMARP